MRAVVPPVLAGEEVTDRVRRCGCAAAPLMLGLIGCTCIRVQGCVSLCVLSCSQGFPLTQRRREGKQERRLDEDELLLQLKTLSGKSATLGDLFRKSDIKAARTTEIASAEDMLELMSMFSDIKFLQESINSRPPSRTASSRSSRSPVRHGTTPRFHIQRTPSQDARFQLFRSPSCASQGSLSFGPEESEVLFPCDASQSGRDTPGEVQWGDVMMSIRTAEPPGPRASVPKLSSIWPEKATSPTQRLPQVEPARQFSTLPRGNSWPRLPLDDLEFKPGPLSVPEESQNRSGSESPKRARIWRSAGNVFDAQDVEVERPFSRSFSRLQSSKLRSEF